MSIWAADFVLFPTKAIEEMVEQYFDLSRRRTGVIHYGFDHHAFASGTTINPELSARIEAWKDQGYALLLNVSTYAVHKNFEVLIEALPLLKERGRKVKLLTTTSRDRTADKAEYDRLVERAETHNVASDWAELGYVPYEALKALYSSADLYVFPSFTESFGHSLVEAMASGLPFVAADMPVNREVCSDAGTYFDSFDAAACADVVDNLLTDDTARALARKYARKRADRFSWDTYVAELCRIFRQVRSDAADMMN